jgi:hypothetical protein
MNIKSCLFIVSTLAVLVEIAPEISAQAAVVTYSGIDENSPIAGPFPNSATAYSNFLSGAAAFGTTAVETFATQPLGVAGPLTVLPVSTQYTIPNGAGSYTLNAPNSGACFSGASTCSGNNQSGFPVSSGDSVFLGISPNSSFGSSTAFTFANPTNSFGFFFSGANSYLGGQFQVSFNDGANELLSIPFASLGGAGFFGFTDTVALTAVTIMRTASGDSVGIDNVTFNSGSEVSTPPVSAVPLPGALALMASVLAGGAGFAGLRRRKGKRTTVAVSTTV